MRGRRIAAALVWSVAWVVAAGCVAWACGALHYDCPVAPGAMPWLFLLAVAAAVVFVPGRRRKLGAALGGFALVLAWWLTLRPSDDRDWQPDVARTAWAEVRGDEVTFHNVRNCDYRTATAYTPRWETRTVRLSALTGADIAVNFWGSPWMAHPIVSFQFAAAPPLCFSIETRKAVGQTYSAIGGFYRQYALIYIVADERDVIRVRTNYRVGEDVYLYRMTLSADEARERFREYIHALNAIRERPRWYNAVTTNCTTSIRAQHPKGERTPWDWRVLVNGKGDEMMYERHQIRTDGLPFAELKARAHINPAAQAADAAPDFSRRIRAGRPGFALEESVHNRP